MSLKLSTVFIRKRSTALILSFVMIMQLIFTMPLAVSAETGMPNDWTNYYVDNSTGQPVPDKLRIQLLQGGSEITDTVPIDPTKDIKVQIYLDNIPVRGDYEDISDPGSVYIKDGDYADILIAENFQLLNPIPEFTVMTGSKQVAKVTLDNTIDSKGNYPLKAHIEFTSSDGIYDDETATDVSAQFNFDMKYNPTGGETTDGITYKIKILNKVYDIYYPPRVHSGQVRPANRRKRY